MFFVNIFYWTFVLYANQEQPDPFSYKFVKNGTKFNGQNSI